MNFIQLQRGNIIFFGLFVSRVEPVLSSEDRVEGLGGSFSLLLLSFFLSGLLLQLMLLLLLLLL